MNTHKLSLKLACSAAALICTTVAAPAWAQSTTPEQAADPAGPEQVDSQAQGDQVSDEETIIVTGSNISGVKPVGNTATVLTREDAVKAGYTTPAELLRTLPQVRSAEYEGDFGTGSFSIQNAGGANTVSLRGVGSTLILIDGRRSVQTGGSFNITEANQLPLAAIERVEVVADGASAVYGADAVAGVINYIVRKDYDGAEVTLRGNNNVGGFEHGLDATLGTTWGDVGGLGRGNILLSYSYANREPYLAGKNPFLRTDARSVGGLDRRISGPSAVTGFNPVIVIQNRPTNNATLPSAGANTYYGVPAGPGTGLTLADLRLNDPDISDLSYFTDYAGARERHQAALYFNQEIGESVEVFFQANYLNRKNRTRNASANVPVNMNPTLYNAANQPTATPNPNYIAIPGVTPGFPPLLLRTDLTVLYPIFKETGARVIEGTDETYNLTGGIRFSLPYEWKGEAFYTFGRNEGCSYCVASGFVNRTAFQYQVNIGAINPLSSLPLTDAQLASFTGAQRQIGHNGLDDAVIKFNGPLFDLPGGTVRAAFGGERMKTFNYNENVTVAGINNVVTQLTNRNSSYINRTVWSAFGEVYVPLIGQDMDIPFMKSLTASAAVRFDDYSDTGQTTNPKFGLTWEVADFLSIYGSWGKSFVAPSLTDINPAAYVSATVPARLAQPIGAADTTRFTGIPFAPLGLTLFNNIGILLGSNPALQPQTSTNWTLGAEFKPGGGFRANVNYFNIDYRNKIVFPQTIAEFSRGLTNGGYRGYEPQIIEINNPATCVNGNLSTADPVLQAILSRPVYNAASGVGSLDAFDNLCAIQGILDSRFLNLGRSKTDGLDIDVSWTGMAGEVGLNASATVNVVFHNDEVVAPGAPSVSRLGYLGDPPNPLKWRGRANIGASYRGFTTTLFGNYAGSFINDQNLIAPTNADGPDVKIPAYTTFDLNVGYSTDFEGRESGFLKGFRASVTVLNLFDRDPQRVLNKEGYFLPGRSNPFGRTVSVQLTGSF